MRRISAAVEVIGGKERPSANLIAGDAMEPFQTSFLPFRPALNNRSPLSHATIWARNH